MAYSAIMQRFMTLSPIPVMVRALLERVLSEERLNACFDQAARRQYTRELMFSSVFELMSLVVMKSFSSINTAYQAEKVDPLGVSITSVYNKLNSLETGVSSALVRNTADEMAAIIESLDAQRTALLPGYRLKMLDGNCLAATEHRLKVLRDQAAGALPGKSLVVYDPALEMATDVITCEDGHAQERALLPQVLQSVHERDVWVMDRNFCVRSFLFAIAERKGYSICRYHKQVPYQELDELKPVGEVETGSVFEQWIALEDEHGKSSRWRKVVVRLKSKTRDGDSELVIITNLPKGAASALLIADLYRKRWTIETMFQQLESHLNSEINTLGYPKAALFGFCVALVAYNVMAVVKAALRKVHGEAAIAEEVSGYYIAGEISRTQAGMAVAIESEEWEVFNAISLEAFTMLLVTLAGNVKLEKYKKSKRGPKKKPPAKVSSKNTPHVSTAKLLEKSKKSP